MRMRGIIAGVLAVLAAPCAAAPSVQSFSPPYGGAASDVIRNRQMWVDETGGSAVYWSYGYGNGGVQFDAHLLKISLGAPTVITTGDDINVDSTIYTISIDYPPIGGYSSGTKLWVSGYDVVNDVDAMFSFDRTTLDSVDVIDTPGGTILASVKATTSDGAIYAAAGTGGIFLFNTATGQFSRTASGITVGHTLGNFIFDAANNLWSYDNHGLFWFWPVTLSTGVPVLGVPTSIVGRTDDGAGALDIDYNPSTNTITEWSPTGTNFWVIPINATSHAIGTINSLTRNGTTGFSDFGSAQAHQWTTSDYVGVLELDGSSNPAIVGLYQRSTGTTTYYDWTFWGSAEPAGMFFSEIAAAQVGDSMVAITGGEGTPDTGNDDEAWLFLFGAGPTCPRGLVLIGVGC